MNYKTLEYNAFMFKMTGNKHKIKNITYVN